MPVTASDLKAEGAERSKAILKAYEGDSRFELLGKQELEKIMQRDQEDDDKLKPGIQLAIDKKVLPATVKVEKVTTIYGDGKTPDAITDEVLKVLGDAPSKGCVMTLQGLSGVGKGTTVTNLMNKIPKAVNWSNGDIFRSLTLLALTYAEQNKCSMEEALTPEKLKEFAGYLNFDQYDGKFDTKIEGLGLKYMVSEIKDTVLKTGVKNKDGQVMIPTVANKTQGEVICFIQDAVKKMTSAGMNVLLEGRTQTLNYIRTPHRIELKLKDMSVVGLRQAALVVGGIASKSGASSEADIKATLDKAIFDNLTVAFRVSAQKGVGFYTKAASSFLTGLEAQAAVGDKPALEAKMPVKSIQLMGLGDAINIAVQVALRLEASGVGTIKSLQTKYCEMENGSAPQISILVSQKEENMNPKKA